MAEDPAKPTKAEQIDPRDERVKIDLDPEEALRVLLRTPPKKPADRR